MDENASYLQSGVASTFGSSESAKASSVMRTLSLISSRHAKEIAAALVYDEKNDKKYQKEMRELAKEKERLKNNSEVIVF